LLLSALFGLWLEAKSYRTGYRAQNVFFFTRHVIC